VQGLAGVTIGYNLQLSGNFVIGLEADAAWLSKAQSHTASVADTYSFGQGCGQGFRTGSITNQYGATAIGTVRARFGQAFDRTLVFVTGGLAVGRVKSSTNAAFSYTETFVQTGNYGTNNGSASWSGSSTKTKYGYALGGGFEHALTNHVIFKLDAMYYNLGKVRTRATGSGKCACSCNNTSDSGLATAQSYKSTHTVDGVMTRVGLNYKF
jgi:outer membrane immunogenic protein